MASTRSFEGQVVIVTGASSGIGRSVALAFGAAGARVALVARSVARLEALAAQMKERGQEALAVAADVVDRGQVAAIAPAVLGRWGRIDVLVNNAGIGAHGPFLWTPYEDFERIVRVNLFGAAYCTHAVLPQMIRQGSGRIVNVTSMIAKRAYPGNAAYCASKFALAGFGEALRAEVRHHGIRVIEICPGFTETEFFDHLLQTGGHRRPERRGMSPDKVADLLLEATRRGRRELLIGVRARVLILLDKLFPSLLDRLLAMRVRHRFSQPEPPAP